MLPYRGLQFCSALQEFHGHVADLQPWSPSEYAGCRFQSHTVSPSPDSEVTPSCVGDMADNTRDAMLKQTPASRNEKAPMEFGYVGIDSILEQMRRKAMKQGFEFNIMVVGESYRPSRPFGVGGYLSPSIQATLRRSSSL